MADQEELIVPVLGDLFLADIDGAERVGQIFTTCGIEVGGRFVKEGDARADGLQHRQAQGNDSTHGLTAGELVVGPLAQFTVDHVAQHDPVILSPGQFLVDLGDNPVDAVGPLADLFAEALRQITGDIAEDPVAQELDQLILSLYMT